jgi:hypothetical protein
MLTACSEHDRWMGRCTGCQAATERAESEELDGLRSEVARLRPVIEAAREATCDTGIPSCVELGKALYEYDKARGALCPTCGGAGSIDDECDRGDGPTCMGPCNGTGLVEPTATAARA